MLDEEEVVVYMTVVLVAAAVALIWMAMVYRRRLREMEHRERLAMIERGLLPPPELDPAGFELRAGLASPVENPSAARSRSAGVMLIGLGGALMVLIAFTAEAAEIGIGIGGAFVLLGAAFLFNGMLLGRHSTARHPPPSTSTRIATGRTDPPGTVGP